jgi:hypothetical protein
VSKYGTYGQVLAYEHFRAIARASHVFNLMDAGLSVAVRTRLCASSTKPRVPKSHACRGTLVSSVLYKLNLEIFLEMKKSLKHRHERWTGTSSMRKIGVSSQMPLARVSGELGTLDPKIRRLSLLTEQRARIVSGSYDETVIIWKRGPDGAWEKSQTLFQNEAVRNAGGRPRRSAVLPQANAPAQANQNQPQANQPQGPAAPQNNFQALAQQAQAQAQAAHNLAQQAQALHAASQAVQGTTTNVTTITANATTTAAATAAAQAATNAGQTAAPAQPGAAPNAAPHHHHHGHHHHHPHPLAGPMNNQGTNSRVFKLQFDARRIICCSQDPTIVGWDFAQNDKDIILASQFFSDSF